MESAILAVLVPLIGGVYKGYIKKWIIHLLWGFSGDDQDEREVERKFNPT